MKYYIVTPAKDEEAFISFTINSIINQTKKPEKWIIVDDGSADGTAAIVREYSKIHPWIVLIQNNKYDEMRSGGSKVVKAFYAGYELIQDCEYDFIVKLDADLTLPENYFQEVAECFAANGNVGICGGYILNNINGKLVEEVEIDYHIRGAFKSVRKECFSDIGGFRPIWNWDGIDELDAMRKGWETKTINLAVIQHRPTSQAYNKYKFQIKDGREAYKLGCSFILSVIRSIVRCKRKPYLAMGLLYLGGYIISFLKHENKYLEEGLSDFINKFHMKRVYKKLKIIR